MGALALTFDDGPDPEGTPAVLDALRAAGARATFFVIAPRAQRHPELVARAVAEGHAVQLHCDVHERHTAHDEAWARRDLHRALGRLRSLGLAPTRWRTPWGDVAAWTGGLARAAGLALTHWTADTHDWRGDSAESMLAATRERLCDGAIVLAHDGLGPGARRGDVDETVRYVSLVADIARRRGLELEPLEPLKPLEPLEPLAAVDPIATRA